jgi:hypothetical protein
MDVGREVRERLRGRKSNKKGRFTPLLYIAPSLETS